MPLPAAILLLTLVVRLPWLVALVVLWPRWWSPVRRGCRRVVCRVVGHDSVFLGLSDTPNGIEIWGACRRCDWCQCLPRAWPALSTVTEVRATRKPKPTRLPGEGRRVLR